LAMFKTGKIKIHTEGYPVSTIDINNRPVTDRDRKTKKSRPQTKSKVSVERGGNNSRGVNSRLFTSA
ncbi:hypothetical protein, partial [Enterobacter hormaechei]